ncbi:hypothetical protein AAX26_01810 [Aliarcobacter thereius]|uniref:hypothetical protein n=1 Tax=Aliarcobacter thereius TaxID=544718 RepID=UPI0008290F87|nr:hypothetical protein [Aliarcobacter thereius]OCL85743.1 hypothetical protein AAX26_01810 [Aliarcobacter thereius]OCL85801.1 hypothetical protein AAX27_02131 [Aliarcobacter thereius]
MKVRVLKPLNHKNKTVNKGLILDLEDVVAKKLIEKKAVEEIKETKTGEQK